jgi:hypothetical protein
MARKHFPKTTPSTGSSRGGESGLAEHISAQDARMGDITTAASSTMAPKDYSEGWPANEGELLINRNLSRGKK